MQRSRVTAWIGILLAAVVTGCGSQPAQSAKPQQASTLAPDAAPPVDRQAEFGKFPEREFIRRNLGDLKWSPMEGNTLGMQTAVVEGDPSKPGRYLTINRFPRGVMSRPHYHPDERWGIVIKGTWYTGEGKDFTPEKTVGLQPGDYMRHPAGGPHFDGALDEEVIVAIGGYGPTSATVIDGGDLFGRSRPSK